MWTQDELNEIVAKYNRGEDTGYTDEEYDVLLEEYLKVHGEESRPYMRQKQSEGINAIVGTIPKVFGTTVPMREGQPTYQEWVCKRFTEKDCDKYDLVIQAKFDGCSIAYDPLTKKYFTRGDYDNGESMDVTDVACKNLTWVDLCDSVVAMKYEAIMSSEDYRELSQKVNYRRARDAVNALCASRNTELYHKHVTLVPLRCQRKDGLHVSDSLYMTNVAKRCNLFDYAAIDKFIAWLLENGPTIEYCDAWNMNQEECDVRTYAVDGCVCSVIDKRTEVIVDEVAIKIIKDIKESKLIRVDYQFGKQGRITPVAIFEPIQFGNVTVDHATLSTLKRAIGLHVGDTVRIMYNIVPYFVSSAYDGDTLIPLPTKCPYCHQNLYISHDYKMTQCVNTHCDGIIFGGIVRYCENMKFFGLSQGILQRFWDLGIVRAIEDLYMLQPDDISGLAGFGEKSANNICESIRKNSQNVPFEVFLGALPINDTSTKTWRTILNGCNVSLPLLKGDIDEFIMNFKPINGIGDVTIQKVTDGLRRCINRIKFLVTDMQFVTIVLPQKNHDNKPRVAMTGTRDKDLTAYLEKKGYCVDNFTKDCVALIVPDHNFRSAKTVKANELGIPIYSIQEGYDKL